MALAAFGKDFSNKVKRQTFGKDSDSFNYFLEKDKEEKIKESRKNLLDN